MIYGIHLRIVLDCLQFRNAGENIICNYTVLQSKYKFQKLQTLVDVLLYVHESPIAPSSLISNK